MSILPGIQITADALDAEKARLEVIAQNIANAQTTRGADGQAYKRREVSFESFVEKMGMNHVSRLRISDIRTDDTPGQKIFNPQHPHADQEGFVELPNVELTREMVDMMTASRAYEANLTVVRTSRQMAQQALIIGK